VIQTLIAKLLRPMFEPAVAAVGAFLDRVIQTAVARKAATLPTAQQAEAEVLDALPAPAAIADKAPEPDADEAPAVPGKRGRGK